MDYNNINSGIGSISLNLNTYICSNGMIALYIWYISRYSMNASIYMYVCVLCIDMCGCY